MSTETLHQIAQSDTPSTVAVPNTWSGLAVWAAGRFGGIIVATAFLFYAWKDSNDSHKAQTERLIQILENKAKTEAEMARVLTSVAESQSRLAVAFDSLKLQAELAHK